MRILKGKSGLRIGAVLIVAALAAALAGSAAAQDGSWETKAPMSVARRLFGVGVAGGIIYAIGGVTAADPIPCAGTTRNEAYDPLTNTWTLKASMPTSREGPGVGVVDGVIYAIGGGVGCGLPPTGANEAYDPVSDTWSTKAPMPMLRAEFGVGVANGILYTVGGFNQINSLATVEAYNPATNTWTIKAPMNTARRGMEHGIAVVNGVLYAIGGGPVGNEVEAYDPATNTWTTKAPMPTRRTYVAVGVIGGVLYAVGGEQYDPCCFPLATVEAYDPGTNTWSAKTSMPTARQYLGAGVVNDVLYAIGGGQWEVVGFLATNEAFTPVGQPVPVASVTGPGLLVMTLLLGLLVWLAWRRHSARQGTLRAAEGSRAHP